MSWRNEPSRLRAEIEAMREQLAAAQGVAMLVDQADRALDASRPAGLSDNVGAHPARDGGPPHGRPWRSLPGPRWVPTGARRSDSSQP